MRWFGGWDEGETRAGEIQVACEERRVIAIPLGFVATLGGSLGLRGSCGAFSLVDPSLGFLL